ncbi:MAG: hypothetical protein WBB52_07525 [Acidimicrobiales bacterium]|jgi:hypothetical protein
MKRYIYLVMSVLLVAGAAACSSSGDKEAADDTTTTAAEGGGTDSGDSGDSGDSPETTAADSGDSGTDEGSDGGSDVDTGSIENADVADFCRQVDEVIEKYGDVLADPEADISATMEALDPLMELAETAMSIDVFDMSEADTEALNACSEKLTEATEKLNS